MANGISASIRRQVLIAEARGYVIPDSSPILEPVPQVLIEPEDDDIFLDFADGLGWSDTPAAYQGYGSKYIWTHNSAPPRSITSALDNAGPDEVPVYNATNGQYEPKNLTDAGIAALIGYDSVTIEIKKPTDRDYTFFVNVPFDIDIEDSFDSIGAGPYSVTMPSGSIAKGSPVVATVTGTDATSEYLLLQITYSYNRNQVY